MRVSDYLYDDGYIQSIFGIPITDIQGLVSFAYELDQRPEDVFKLFAPFAKIVAERDEAKRELSKLKETFKILMKEQDDHITD